MRHLVLVGACYLDTILSVPHYPDEDSKLRASKLSVRRGGNCPNSAEVLAQLLAHDAGGDDVQLDVIAMLPERDAPATNKMLASFGEDGSRIRFDNCLFRAGHTEPASSYVIRSEASGSRTLVNYNDLPEMTVDEFQAIMQSFPRDDEYHFHFEGRIPDVILGCVHMIRRMLPGAKVSVEIEKPGREGLLELAAEADVVFYSQSWATARGHGSAEECLRNEAHPRASLALCTWGAKGATAISASDGLCRYPEEGPLQQVRVVDAIGAGDTFMAGVLYGLVRHSDDWSTTQKLSFASRLATLKVQREGFGGLGVDMMQGLSREG